MLKIKTFMTQQGWPVQLRTWAFILLCIVMLAACSPKAAQQSTPTATSAGLQAAQLGPTSTASATVPAGPTMVATPSLVPLPTPDAKEKIAGPTSAAAELVLYSDFDCSLCVHAFNDISSVLHRHPQQVSYYFRLYPLLGVHQKSAQAAAAFIAADQFGVQPAMHDLLFDGWDQWGSLTPVEFRQWLLAAAFDLGLDQAEFAAAMNSSATLSSIQDSYEQARQSGVPGVPFLIINDQPFLLDWTESNVEASVRLALLSQEQFLAAPNIENPNELPRFGQFEFNQGLVKFQLFPEAAPAAVSSFTFLARSGWYSDTALYRVRPGSLVMGGDPTNTGLGNAGYFFEVEIDPVYHFDQPGMIALDNDGPASNSSRFLITLEPRPDLNGAYTIIGQVTDGLELLQELPARDPLADLLDQPAAILERISLEQ